MRARTRLSMSGTISEAAAAARTAQGARRARQRTPALPASGVAAMENAAATILFCCCSLLVDKLKLALKPSVGRGFSQANLNRAQQFDFDLVCCKKASRCAGRSRA